MKNKKVLWGALFGLATLVLVTNMNVFSSLAMSIIAGGTNDNLYLNPTGNGRVVIGGDSIVVASKSADPTTNRTGQIYFNTASKEFRGYDGTTWRSLAYQAGNTHSTDLESGSSQYLSISDASQTGLDITGNITVEAWIKPESDPSDGSPVFLLSKWGNAAADRSWLLDYRNEGGTYKLFFDYRQDSTNFTRVAAALPGSLSGSWTHVAATVNVGTKTVTFYKNGVALTNDAYVDQNATSIQNGAGPFFIGALQGASPTGFFDGKVDDVRVWSELRSSGQISANYSKELAGTESNLQGYWKLNNNFEDGTSNNNDLTNNGSAVFSTDRPF